MAEIKRWARNPPRMGMLIPRLRDRDDYPPAKEGVDRRAEEWGEAWAAVYLEDSQEIVVVDYRELMRPNLERHLVLYRRDGGQIKPEHPGYRKHVEKQLEELVEAMGPEKAQMFAHYLDTLSPEELEEFAAGNWAAGVVVAFRNL